MKAHAIAAEPRILVLSKRRYMSRDLLDERYGRFRELPLALASQRLAVRGLCLSYRPRPEGLVLDGEGKLQVCWSSLNLHRLASPGPRGYWRELERIREEFRPNLVWACSDVPHAVLGVAAARKLDARLVIDLYDNFEGYPLSCVPGVNAALRQAIHAADGVSCVSEPLLRRVRDDYGYPGKLEVIENAIPAGVFQRQDAAVARATFHLPASGLLIGTAGALSPGRGTQFLLSAFQTLAREREDAHLVLAGPLDPQLGIPEHPRIHYLGLLQPKRIPMLLSALDISVIGNRDTAFGRYCFPQKLYESLACGVPVAVAKIGAMADLLREHPQNLYEVDDVESLLATLRNLALHPSLPLIDIPTWEGLGVRLGDFLRRVADGDRRGKDRR